MLRDTIADDMRTAMKARDQVRVQTLRMLMTTIKNLQVERGHELDDDEVLEAVTKDAKRRRESIDAYTDAGRRDLADKEQAELDILQTYLPAQMSAEELAAVVDQAIADAGATSPKDMGAVMKIVVPAVKGRADGKAVSELVRARLGG